MALSFLSKPTSNVGQLFHVRFEKTFETFGVLVQRFNPFSQVKVFARQSLDLVLEACLGVVRRRLVDRLKKSK